jgi:Flp pilus assembly protein TadG
VQAQLGHFRRDEDGSMVIFSLFLLLVMLIVGGMAIDLMRFEAARTRLQSTLDRSVLAAADLDQARDAEDVVEDWFDKAGLLDRLTGITVTETINSRSVGATASMDVDMIFLRMLGMDSLAAPAAGRAIESVSDIEVMLVLDVSGSMASNNRLVNLKAAANEFVGTILANDRDERISVGIVPFNGQVNLGPVLRAQFNAIDNHGVADVNCIDLPASVYSQLPMSRTLPMPMTAHADTFSSTTRSTSYVTVASNAPVNTNRWCPPSTANVVRLPTSSINALRAHINGLTAVGATSINAGMRWGMALLDPASQPLFDTLIAAGRIPAAFAGRPFAYDREDTLKVVVLMTDGEHFAEERVNAGYRVGNSPIFRANGDGNLSIFHASRVDSSSATTLCNSRPFWVPHLGAWHSRPWNGTTPSASACYSPTAVTTGVTGLTWPQVWAQVRMQWVAWQLYARALGTTNATRDAIYTNTLNAMRTLTPTTTMDAQLQQICSLARQQGVVVFGIAFEAPPDGQTQIAQCASSPAHYYNAQGLEIQTAFRAIASQINQLRLIE